MSEFERKRRLSKRDWVATNFERAGLQALLQRLPRRGHLVALTYHRIGDPETAVGDRGNFSASQEEFALQLEFLKRHFEIIGLDDLVDYTRGSHLNNASAILITFDDGYLDNYQNAFHILKSFDLPAAFFLTTTFVGTNHMPWWDVIAENILKAQRSNLRLEYPSAIDFSLVGEHRLQTISSVLKLYKSPLNTDPNKFLSSVYRATDAAIKTTPERLFLNWQEAREMSASGMHFGSHTHSHQILGNLSLDQQTYELEVSKTTLEANLDRKINTVAYPDGLPGTFNENTILALRSLGYQLGFANYPGANKIGAMDPFFIKRMSIYNDLSGPLFRMRAIASGISGNSVI